MNRPTLLGLQSAFPSLVLTQNELFQDLLSDWYQEIPQAERIFEQSKVRQRHFIWDPRIEVADHSPGTGDRMKAYKRLVLELGSQTMDPLLKNRDRERIGSFVMGSCTGYFGPTPDLYLAKQFGLRSSLRRTFIGHMGCYAAFNVLKVALDSLAARPDDQVLMNCTELSSIHFRPVKTVEQAVIHALFGDASASLLLSCEEDGSGLQFIRTYTEQLYETSDLMTWQIENDGFFMTLSPYVPFILSEKIIQYLEKLLGPENLAINDIHHWGIHPGGPKIVEFLADQLKLTSAQQRASWHVLGEYGNCSSVTTLLVLEEIIRNDQPEPGQYGVLMAFGPGLTIESVLIRF